MHPSAGLPIRNRRIGSAIMIQPAASLPTAPPVVEQAPADSRRPHPRLLGQMAAARTKRRHFLRALRRVAVLGAADLALLDVARIGLQLLRSHPWTSAVTTELLPRGLMGGWGSMIAVLIGLGFAGAYASEERWASTGAGSWAARSGSGRSP